MPESITDTDPAASPAELRLEFFQFGSAKRQTESNVEAMSGLAGGSAFFGSIDDVELSSGTRILAPFQRKSKKGATESEVANAGSRSHPCACLSRCLQIRTTRAAPSSKAQSGTLPRRLQRQSGKRCEKQEALQLTFSHTHSLSFSLCLFPLCRRAPIFLRVCRSSSFFSFFLCSKLRCSGYLFAPLYFFLSLPLSLPLAHPYSR